MLAAAAVTPASTFISGVMNAMSCMVLDGQPALAQRLMSINGVPRREAMGFSTDRVLWQGIQDQWVGQSDGALAVELNQEASAPRVVAAPRVSTALGSAIIKIARAVKQSAPRMVLLPGGVDIIGAGETAAWHCFDPYKVAETPVTRAQYLSLAKVCGLKITLQYDRSDRVRHAIGNQADYPVVNVTSNSMYEYATWLSMLSGMIYRLPSRPEWERAARGPAVMLGKNMKRISAEMTIYHFWGSLYENAFLTGERGEEIIHDSDRLLRLMVDQQQCVSAYHAFGSQPLKLPHDRVRWCHDYVGPVIEFPSNAYGLYGMSGNIYETAFDQGRLVYLGGSHRTIDMAQLRVASALKLGLDEPHTFLPNITTGFRLVADSEASFAPQSLYSLLHIYSSAPSGLR